MKDRSTGSVETWLKSFQRGTLLIVSAGLQTFLLIFGKNVPLFCACPASQPEAKLKGFGLMSLAEISR
jgi:hypothetical protein